MLTALDPLRQLNFASLLFRLALAMFFGGMIGMERERKRRPAGFRTYMLVCLGATLAGIVSQYNFIMLSTISAVSIRFVPLSILHFCM